MLEPANFGCQILGPGLTSAVVDVTGGYGADLIVGAAAFAPGAGLLGPVRGV